VSGEDTELSRSLPLNELSRRIVRGIREDNCPVYAAQLAYIFLFALFPFLLFLTSLLAYIPVSHLLDQLLGNLGSFVSAKMLHLIRENLHTLLSVRRGGLLSLGAILALWSASGGVATVMAALNHAFRVREHRPFWKVRAVAILLVIGFSVLIITSLLLLMTGPRIGAWIASMAGLGELFLPVWNVLRWPAILIFMTAALTGLYRFAPAVQPSWRQIFPGAAAATVLWVAASLAFSFYVGHFGSYDKTYGSIGTVILLLTWLYLSAFVILIGGEIGASIAEFSRDRGGESEARNSTEGGETMNAMKTKKRRSLEEIQHDIRKSAVPLGAAFRAFRSVMVKDRSTGKAEDFGRIDQFLTKWRSVLVAARSLSRLLGLRRRPDAASEE
jgi:membrane protein